MLDAQQMGRNPSLVTDEVLPSVDMLPFWMALRTTIDVITGPNVLAPAGSTTIGQFIVPENEVWIPLSLSVRGIVETINQAVNLRVQTSVPARQSPQSNQNTVHVLAHSPPGQTSLTDDWEASLTYTWKRAIVAIAGRRFTGSVANLAAGATTFNTTRASLEYLAFPA